MTKLPRKSGIYGLVSLGQGSVDALDALALGLRMPAVFANSLLEGSDRSSAAVSYVENEAGSTILVGELEEQAELACLLGLPAKATPAAICQAALARYGSKLPLHMVGEYSCVSVDKANCVTLVQSIALRDPLLYAVWDGCLAVSPSVFALARLRWVGRAIDPVGLAASLGRARTRPLQDNFTILQNVREVLPGETVRIDPNGGVSRTTVDLFPPMAPFKGTQADALFAVDEMLAKIVGARASRTAQPAILLSGGLDSSLLATFFARTRVEGQQISAITSVAPPGTKLIDERAEAAEVAQVLGLEHFLCYPPMGANPYLPRTELFLGRNGPLLSNRHVLTDAMQDLARRCGATLLINGTFGEGSVTARVGTASRAVSVGGRLRSIAQRMLGQLWPPQLVGAGLHVRLAPELLATLPASFFDPPRSPNAVSTQNNLFGYSRTVLKAMPQPNEFVPGAIRMDYPFRDLRLLRLFASLPQSFLRNIDGNREIARQLLAGHVPDRVRLRQSGQPASPDHLLRLRAFAPVTRSLNSEWRAAGVGDWVDLLWLDQALARVATEKGAYSAFGNEVQLTAMAAAFFYWWLKPEAI